MSELRHVLKVNLDPLHWARHPKSVKAVEFLLSGARRDHRLLQIAREHVQEGGKRIRCDAGIRYLMSVAASDPSLSGYSA